MAKLTAGRIEGFVRNPDQKFRAILLFGADTGLVSERWRAIARTVVEDLSDPFRMADLDGARLVADPAILADEAAAIAMTGGRRVVIVRDVGDRNLPQFTEFLKSVPGDALVLALAGNLESKSKLRKLFETADNAVAINCFLDDEIALNRVIDSGLAADNVRIDADARDYLAGHLGQDRTSSRGEVAKLALYAGPGGHLTIADVRDAIGDGAAPALDDVLYAAFDGRAADLDRALEQLFALGTSPVPVLRTAGGHALRLLSVQAAVAAGKDMNSALKGLRPPVFFKFKEPFIGQVRQWRGRRLSNALQLLMQAEGDCKQTGRPDTLICSRTLHQIAAMASRARSRDQGSRRAARR